MGIRLDGGTAYSGAVITRYYDSLLEKVTAWAPTPEMAIARLDRALREFRIRGVSTNIAFVENLLKHPTFLDNSYTTKFIDTTPELFHFSARRDRATKILTYVADITVNGHPETAGRPKPPAEARPPKPPVVPLTPPPPGARQLLEEQGAEGGRRLDAGPGAAAHHRHHDARRAPEPARDADAVVRHDRGGAGLCPHAAGALQRRVLGRGDLRRRVPVPAGVPVAAAARPARANAEPDDADAAQGVERGRLHQLSRQRGSDVRGAGGVVGGGRLPGVRFAQLGREHAGGDGRGDRLGQDLRGRDLLHRRHSRSGPGQVRP